MSLKCVAPPIQLVTFSFFFSVRPQIITSKVPKRARQVVSEAHSRLLGSTLLIGAWF